MDKKESDHPPEKKPKPSYQPSPRMTRRKVIGEVTDRGMTGTDTFSVEWCIPEFSSLLCCEARNTYVSPIFKLAREDSRLSLFPNWIHGKAKRIVKLAFLINHVGPPQSIQVSLGIKGTEGVELLRERTWEARRKFVQSWVQVDSWPKSYLEANRSTLLPGDVLTITCTMRMSGFSRGATECDSEPVQAGPSSSQADVESREPIALIGGIERMYKEGIEKLSEDLGGLLASGEKSDFTVQVGDVKFKVHGCILSARCPTLSASPRQDKATHRIIEEDCEPEVFKQFVHYLYKGFIQSGNEEKVSNLYRLANKYSVDNLKQQCVQHMLNRLNVQTFCEVVQLALAHGEGDLLEQSIAFATENIRPIVRSDGWQRFIRERPAVANEVLVKSLGPPSKCQKRKRRNI